MICFFTLFKSLEKLVHKILPFILASFVFIWNWFYIQNTFNLIYKAFLSSLIKSLIWPLATSATPDFILKIILYIYNLCMNLFTKLLEGIHKELSFNWINSRWKLEGKFYYMSTLILLLLTIYCVKSFKLVLIILLINYTKIY